MAIETRALLATRYISRDPVMLTHSYDTVVGRILCGRVRQSSVADSEAADIHAVPTCPRCAERDPRTKQHAGDGPFILKSIFQF
jgi:hypothetical protein